jgi:hypothetical protein
MQQQWFINNSNQFNMFRGLNSPIFRNTRMCVTACGIMYPGCCRTVAWKRRHCLRFQATGRQHPGYIIPQAVTHSLVLLKMGGFNSRNMLSWYELIINHYCCIWLVFISFILEYVILPCGLDVIFAAITDTIYKRTNIISPHLRLLLSPGIEVLPCVTEKDKLTNRLTEITLIRIIAWR